MFKNKKVILIIEDEQEALENLVFLLKDTYELLLAKNNAEAINHYEAHHMNIDCILLDINLNDELNGLELLERFGNFCTILAPIIVISGYQDPNNIIFAMKNNAYDYIFKPYNAKNLLETIEEAMKTGANLIKNQDNFDYKCLFELIDSDRRISQLNQILNQTPNDQINSKDIQPFIGPQPFHIKNALPTLKEQLESATGIKASPPPERYTCLVVDDEKEARENLRFYLENDYHILEAENDKTVMQAIQSHPDIDLILMDLNLGQSLTGTELTYIIKKDMKCSADIVAFSAYDDRETIVKAMRCGAVDYIVKPALKEKILETIQSVLNKRYLWDTIKNLYTQFRKIKKLENA